VGSRPIAMDDGGLSPPLRDNRHALRRPRQKCVPDVIGLLQAAFHFGKKGFWPPVRLRRVGVEGAFGRELMKKSLTRPVGACGVSENSDGKERK